MRLPPAATRGATEVADRVVGRIAAQAARELLGDGSQDGAAARARAGVRRGRARITLALDLPYPADLARVTGDVQRHVAERAAQLTGLPIAEVSVRIEELVPASTAATGRQEVV